jgi:hypothetical protein
VDWAREVGAGWYYGVLQYCTYVTTRETMRRIEEQALAHASVTHPIYFWNTHKMPTPRTFFGSYLLVRGYVEAAALLVSCLERKGS